MHDHRVSAHLQTPVLAYGDQLPEVSLLDEVMVSKRFRYLLVTSVHFRMLSYNVPPTLISQPYRNTAAGTYNDDVSSRLGL